MDSIAESEALDGLWWRAFSDLDGQTLQTIAQRMLELQLPPTSPEAFKIHVLRATQSIQLGRVGRATEILEAAEHNSRDGDIDTFARYLCVKADLLAALGRPKEALSYARLAVDISEKRDDLFLRWRARNYLSYALQSNGDLAEALESYRIAEEAALAAGLTWEVILTRARAAWNALLLGKVDLAHRLISSCFETEHEKPWMEAVRSYIGILVALRCGDDALLQQAADERVLQQVVEGGDHYTLGPVIAAFYCFFRHCGRNAEAEPLLDLAITRIKLPDCAWTLFPLIAAYGSDSALRQAQTLLAMYPADHRVARAFRMLFAAMLAARRGNSTESEQRSGEAQVLFDDYGCELYAVTCLEVAGRLAEAHRRYRLLGALGDAKRIGENRGRRGRPRRSYEASRERREILRLLLMGLTSSAIADRLGVSERTIKSRISEIYDFAGVSNRRELMALHTSTSAVASR
jgi:DNA-binding CsgD family transcriptional regulator